MGTLISDLLTFSRVGTHGGELKPTDCAEVVQTVLRGMRETAAEAGAEIVVGELPTVMGDRTQLEQVFQNLISNGIKFRVEEPPRIEISARRRADAWELCVSDNGIGIEQSYHERIFVVFQRLHEREKYTGNGIGLSIVKKIVERHGGKVRLESAPGEGTRLFFTLKSAKGTQQKERP